VTARVTLPCLSVRALWAWCIINGGKDVENRSRRTRYRGPILIHSASTFSQGEDYDAVLVRLRSTGRGEVARRAPAAAKLPRGRIIGACVVTGVQEPGAGSSPWRFRDWYGWTIERPIALPPRPVKGRLGLFPVELTARECELLAPILKGV
jgi:hypothetical protein